MVILQKRFNAGGWAALSFLNTRSAGRLSPVASSARTVNARVQSASDWLARMGRELEPFHLELESLEEQDTVQMMLSILVPSDADFAQWVFNETRGHPFYLLETLKDLLERRVLHPKQMREGQWGFEVDAEHDLGKAMVRIFS